MISKTLKLKWVFQQCVIASACAWVISVWIAFWVSVVHGQKSASFDLFSMNKPAFYDETPEKAYFISLYFFSILFSFFSENMFDVKRWNFVATVAYALIFGVLAIKTMGDVFGISVTADWPSLSPPVKNKHAFVWLIGTTVFLVAIPWLSNVRLIRSQYHLK